MGDSSNENPEKNGMASQVLNTHTYKVLEAMFEMYVIDIGMPQGERETATTDPFIDWMGSPTDEDRFDPKQLAVKCEIDEQEVRSILSFLETPRGVSAVKVVWPYLVLRDRKDEHPFFRLYFVMMLHWEDGCTPVEIEFKEDDVTDTDNIGSAEAISRVQAVAQGVEDMLYHVGVDGIRAAAAIHGRDDKSQLLPRFTHSDVQLLLDVVKNADLDEATRNKLYDLAALTDVLASEEDAKNLKLTFHG